ncbi:MAG: S8 family serine peptidase [Oscillospiraceae bacterium]|nr:S8 family serine peptidase [Oscillospiraceae bacterium]
MFNNFKRFLCVLLGMSIALSLGIVSAVAAENNNGDEHGYIEDEVIAIADSTAHALEIAEFYGLKLKSFANGLAVFAVKNPEYEVQRSVNAQRTRGMRFASDIPELSLNLTYEFHYTQEEIDATYYDYNSTDFSNQYHHNIMNNYLAWELSTGTGTMVAVMDSGIDIFHPDFAGRILPNSAATYDATSRIGLSHITDTHGHGTHVAGIVAGSRNFAAKTSGVAPDAQLLVLKVDNPATGGIPSSSVIRAINYAVDQGAAVINMSLGRKFIDGPNAAEQTAITNAFYRGVTLVASAGNDRTNNAGYPGAYTEVIAVSGTNDQGLFDDRYSNYGPQVALAAPGTSVNAADLGTGHRTRTGTSMAAPNVAGTAVLIKSIRPDFTPQQIRERLTSTARRGQPGVVYNPRNDRYGYGVVDSYEALKGLIIPPSGVYLTDFPDEVFRNSVLQVLNARDTSKVRTQFDLIHPDIALMATTEMLRARGGLAARIQNLTGIEHFTGLKILDIRGNNLTTFDISKHPLLEELDCSDNYLNTLVFPTGNSRLKLLNCSTNMLSTINVANSPDLVELDVSINNLSELDVTSNAKLEVLNCSTNQLATLVLTENKELTELEVAGNRLKELDVSQNTKLKKLVCAENLLTELDLSNNPELESVNCNDNLLVNLDLSASYFRLREADVRNNYMFSTADVSGVNEIFTELRFAPQKNIGDINNDGLIDAADLSLLRRYITKMPMPGEYIIQAMDLNRDGKINIADLTYLKYYIAHYTGFPIRGW